MTIIAIVTDNYDSTLKVVDYQERECSLRSMKIFMTKHLKLQGFHPETVYWGLDWNLSGDNPIWLLRRKPSRRFHVMNDNNEKINRYVYLIDKEKYAAYDDIINRLKKEADEFQKEQKSCQST